MNKPTNQNFGAISAQHVVYPNYVISLAAGTLSAGWSFFHGLEKWLGYGFAFFFATLCIYNLQRIIKLKTTIVRTNWLHWVQTKRKYLFLLSCFSGFLSLLISTLLVDNLFNDLLVLLIGLSFSVFYVVPIKGIKLRELPYLKTPIIAIVWTSILFLLPWINEGRNPQEILGELIAFFFFFSAMTIPFDIRDLSIDIEMHKTIPQAFGIRGSKILALVLFTLFFIIIAIINQEIRINVLFIVFFISFVSLVLTTNQLRSILHFALIDSMMIILGMYFFTLK